jgi:hypothetical protein
MRFAIALESIAKVCEQRNAGDLLVFDDVLAQPLDVTHAELDGPRMNSALKILADDIGQLETGASVLVERSTVEVNALFANHALEGMSAFA